MSSLHLNVNFSFQQLVDVVKQLSPSEKLKLSDVIWNESIDIPVEHQKLVSERVKESKKNPKRMLDWETASKGMKP